MNKWIEQLKKLYEKYRETFWYLVFGGLTTLLNIATFYVLYELLHMDKLLANSIAWIAGVLFAFFTNKIFVFRSEGWDLKKFLWEFLTFVGARLFSGIFDNVFLLFFTEWVFHFPAMPIKIISNILVIIMNYVFSKWIVFRKRKPAKPAAEDEADRSGRQGDQEVSETK